MPIVHRLRMFRRAHDQPDQFDLHAGFETARNGPASPGQKFCFPVPRLEAFAPAGQHQIAVPPSLRYPNRLRHCRNFQTLGRMEASGGVWPRLWCLSWGAYLLRVPEKHGLKTCRLTSTRQMSAVVNPFELPSGRVHFGGTIRNANQPGHLVSQVTDLANKLLRICASIQHRDAGIQFKYLFMEAAYDL